MDLKLGILGTGMIVLDVLSFLNELDIEKKVILSRPQSKEKTLKLQKEYGLDEIYYDYDALLESDIDTVYVALPNHLHYEYTKKAIVSGKDVIVEKPITSNPKQLEELITLANQYDVMMVEAMNIHHLPAYQALKEEVKNVGEVKMITFNFSQYSSRYDRFKQGDIAPVFDYKQNGGALMDLGVYNIHAIVGIFGEPKDVQYYPNIERKIDTSGVCVLDYGTFKAVSIAAKDCKAPLSNVIQTGQGCLVFKTSPSVLTSFERITNTGEQKVFDFTQQKHRLYYEFVNFIEMFKQHDKEAMNELLKISMTVSKVIYQARQRGGVIFLDD